MKKCIITLGIIISANILYGQDNLTILTKENQTLKKENETIKAQLKNLKQDTTYLRKVNSTCELLLKSRDFEIINTNSNLKFEILSVKGDRISQTVKMDFFISQSLLHQSFELHTEAGKPKAWDLLGSLFEFKSAIFSNNSTPSYSFGVIKVLVPTDVRVKGEIVFRNIMPSTEKFSLIQIKYYLDNADGGSSSETQVIEIKNTGIKW